MKLSVEDPLCLDLMCRKESARPVRQHRTGFTHRGAISMSNESIPDWERPATAEDLRWWLETAPKLTWTCARTYADFAPHWYVVGGRTPSLPVTTAAASGGSSAPSESRASSGTERTCT